VIASVARKKRFLPCRAAAGEGAFGYVSNVSDYQ